MTKTATAYSTCSVCAREKPVGLMSWVTVNHKDVWRCYVCTVREVEQRRKREEYAERQKHLKTKRTRALLILDKV